MKKSVKKITLFALVSALSAVSSQATPSRYGMIGLTAGETMRINVANPELPNPNGVPPDPCRVKLVFLDSSGNPLLPAVQFTLQAGKSAHYDLNGDKLVPPPGTTVPVQLRTEVRPVVLLLPNPAATATDAAFPPGPCVSSVEVFDNANGKTLLNFCPPGPPVVPIAQPSGPPDKIFGQLGIVSGQTIRLNAANVLDPGTTAFPPDPCRVTLVFFGPEGGILAHSTQVVQPGAATFLDFSLPTTVGDVAVNPVASARGEVRAVVTVEPVGANLFPPDPCRATLEVFDNASGRTTAIQSPQHVQGLANPPDPD